MPDSSRSTSHAGSFRLAAMGALAALLFAAGCADVAGPPITAPLVPSAPSALLVPGDYDRVSAGLFHSCGLSDGLVACWGRNDAGQATPPPGYFTAIHAGTSHTCGVRRTGVAVCWGSNEDGKSTVPPGF